MYEITPIRKVVSGVSVNTETAYCVHIVTKIISEFLDRELNHRHVSQGLYQAKDGQYFLAFWNKMVWNESALEHEYVDDAALVDDERAEAWVMHHCPEKLELFKSSRDKAEKLAGTQVVTIRIPGVLKEYLSFGEEFGAGSLNGKCIYLINAGIMLQNATGSFRKGRSSREDPLRMLDGRPAIDEFQIALKFDDPYDQQLAKHAEMLCSLARHSGYLAFMNYVLETLNSLFWAQHDRSGDDLRCFAGWVAQFYRASYSLGRKRYAAGG